MTRTVQVRMRTRIGAGQAHKLERALKALANVNRILLLQALERPSRMTEIELTPSRSDSWGEDDRPISRQAVRGHLEALTDLGVVTVLGEGRDVRYVVNHARLYEVTERLRTLATVRPEVEVAGETLQRAGAPATGRVEGAHMVLVRGVREGRSYALSGPAPEGGWVIGRHADAHVPLDYDPFVSGRHALVVQRDGRHFIADLPGNRNGTEINWAPIRRGAVAPLEAGDIVGIGMSLLVYRPG